ncbi:acetolactate synthase regulatory subunit [Azospirillum lipoferum]|uniref:ACT domain-containing protein n=1 Tax=Azospirillum lipoferum TaxID=193 RepID=A0A5A9GXM9_AZOLI|nr:MULTISPECIES: hypothetical protein [Azospirillum]KAA0598334.1 hypothetical protein FZ942_04420 [Azospirillum lipoferum]MCP1609678.1 acetolactate synthase regulatory subunit [Azospirillum lipoferum]MDW5535015.1 hypothetical protein [Azospirillum sp. NL1]
MSSTVNTHAVNTAPASASDARAIAPGRRVVFALVADADPGTLPRVLEYVAKRGLVPLALHSRLTGDMLDIVLEVGDLPQAETDHIGRCLGQIPMVARVTVTELAAKADPGAELVADLVAAE